MRIRIPAVSETATQPLFFGQNRVMLLLTRLTSFLRSATLRRAFFTAFLPLALRSFFFADASRCFAPGSFLRAARQLADGLIGPVGPVSRWGRSVMSARSIRSDR